MTAHHWVYFDNDCSSLQWGFVWVLSHYGSPSYLFWNQEACPSDGTSPNFNIQITIDLLQGPSIFSFIADQAPSSLKTLPRTRDPGRMKIVLALSLMWHFIVWFSEVRIRTSRFTTILSIGAPPSLPAPESDLAILTCRPPYLWTTYLALAWREWSSLPCG